MSSLLTSHVHVANKLSCGHLHTSSTLTYLITNKANISFKVFLMWEFMNSGLLHNLFYNFWKLTAKHEWAGQSHHACWAYILVCIENLPLWVSLILSKWLPTKMTLGMSSPQLQLDSCYEGRPPTIHVAGLLVFVKGLNSSGKLVDFANGG